jgi:predicted transglutaminase-like cysteine proteinase
MSNNHDLLLQASIIRQPSFGRHDNDDLGAELASSSTMIMFQSALRPIASLLLATLFLQSFSYGSEGSATGEAIWQSAPAPKDTQVKHLASLALTTTAQALGEPFGFLSTVPVINGELAEKWKIVRDQVESEVSVFSRCVTKEECPAAARRFLKIIAMARAYRGPAQVGFINRAVNLSIVPMSDMKQWGVLDRWSSPLETLTTGRGDCEDYAIVKYVALLGAGVHRQDVKVVVLRDLLRNEDHAITVTRIGEKWIVLDNRWLH